MDNFNEQEHEASAILTQEEIQQMSEAEQEFFKNAEKYLAEVWKVTFDRRKL